MNRTIALFVLFLLVGATVGPASVAAAENPRFETYVPNPTLAPGQTAQLTVQFVNDAKEVDDQVKTARNVKATMEAGSTPFTIESGTQLLGVAQDGQPVTKQFVVSVPQDVKSGTYDIPIKLYYEYGTNDKKTVTVHATVTIRDRAVFQVESVSSDLSVGDSGTVTVTMRNVGSKDATDATVNLQSKTANVVFGGNAATAAYVGSWPAGENRTVSVDAAAPPGADNGTFPVAATVSYTDPNGDQESSFPKTAGVSVAPKRAHFALSDVTSTLRVGEKGTVNMTVTNQGGVAKNAVVTISSLGMNVNPRETQYAVGTLAHGQSARVSFPIEVSDSAESGPRQFSFVVTYTNGDDQQRKSDPLDAQVGVGPQRDRFAVSAVDASVVSGGSGTVTVKVTNNGDVPVTNVNAKVFANDPLSTTNDQAFVNSLAPGESTTLKFGVSVSSGALAKTYPLELDFKYDQGGSSKLSKAYQVPVTATEPQSSGLPITYIVGGVVVVVVLVGAFLWYRRR